MIEEIDFQLDVAKEAMDEIIIRLDRSLAKIRAGKANPQMLSTVNIDYYGVQTPLSQAANVSATDAQTISIQPFDPSSIEFCEKNKLNYVSCSPYRVPIARLAAAQAYLKKKI